MVPFRKNHDVRSTVSLEMIAYKRS